MGYTNYEAMPLDQMLARIQKYHPGDSYKLVEKAYHFAEKAHAQRVQLPGVLDAFQRAERFLPDFFELFLHKRMLLFVIIQKNKPSARNRDERPCFRGTTRCSQRICAAFCPVTAAITGAS